MQRLEKDAGDVAKMYYHMCGAISIVDSACCRLLSSVGRCDPRYFPCHARLLLPACLSSCFGACVFSTRVVGRNHGARMAGDQGVWLDGGSSSVLLHATRTCPEAHRRRSSEQALVRVLLGT